MRYPLFFAAMAFGLFLQACKSKHPVRPKEYYDKMENEIKVSTINLPVRISKDELENSINSQLGEILYEDSDMRGDGLKMKATKQDKITLEINGQQVKYQVPIDLWVQKDLAITVVEGEGALAVELVTDFDIKSNWDFETATRLTAYKWTKAPTVKTPFGKLNVTGIADQFIDQAKSSITSSIDKELRDLFDLKGEVGKAWKEMKKPFLISAEQSTFLMINPTEVGMTPLKTTNNIIQSTVVISAMPKLSVGRSSTSPNEIQLPDFQLIDKVNDDDFEVLISSSITFTEAQRVAKENMLGKTYEYGSRTVTVRDVELYGQGNKLVVKTNLSGSYNGDIYLIGKPEYNARRNQIELENVEFDFSSKKTLLRTASWLFKGTFKRKIQDELDFHLTQNLDNSKDILQREISRIELTPGIELNGDLHEVSVSEVYIGADAIHVNVGLDGKLNLNVKGIGK